LTALNLAGLMYDHSTIEVIPLSKNRNYKRGRELEYRIKKELTDAGFFGATRSAGSHGVFDVVAVAPLSYVLFVQAKRTKERLNPETAYKEDLEKCRELAKVLPREAQLELWVWTDHKGWTDKLVIKQAGELYNEGVDAR
jgi:Holliday junction resolvase